MGAEDRSQPRTADLLLTSLAKQNLTALIKAIHHMEHYWAGIAYVSGLLDEKAAGLGFSRAELGMERQRNIKTYISLPDKGLLRRFTSESLTFAKGNWPDVMRHRCGSENCTSDGDLFEGVHGEGGG